MSGEDVNVKDLRGRDVEEYIKEMPTECPWCLRHMVLKSWGFYRRGDWEIGPIEGVFQCTNGACGRLFVCVFESLQGPFYQPTSFVPEAMEEARVSEEIGKHSPDFLRIYAQGLRAEALGLDESAGMTLRKALEVLVKDFAIAQHPNKEAAIKKERLSNCLHKYVEDPRVTQCAERAIWIGNDETHYERRWQDRDVDDLKLLIRLTLNWMESLLLTERYVSEMPRHQPAEKP